MRKEKGSSASVETAPTPPKQDMRPPEFKLFRQDTQDPEPREVDLSPGALEHLAISRTRSGGPSSQATPITPPTAGNGGPTSDHKRESVGTTPHSQTSPKSNEKRFSKSGRLLSSLSRRPSLLSNRSRSSTYVPEFRPIDQNGDVEAQWEERATLLARAGPPSPAIPRNDSIFDTGPPKLPPVDFGQSAQSPPSTTRHALGPDRDVFQAPSSHSPSSSSNIATAKDSTTTPPRRSASSPRHAAVRSHSGRTARATSIAETGAFTHEGQSKDDLLQSAIREHERNNLEVSAQLFKKAAQGEDGLPMGQLMYGLSLRHGWGVQRDEARALHWLRLAASSSASAVEASALSATTTDNASAGDDGVGGRGSAGAAGGGGGGVMKGDLVLAIFELGNCFRHGWGIEVDRDLARNYYETAANLGDADAMYEVAWCYETGFGTGGRDKYKAAYWYRRSETAGTKVPGMQWIWKPKYSHDPFLISDQKSPKKDRRRVGS